MMRYFIAYILLTLLLILICSGCTAVNVLATDPRCQARQYCPYTDAPPAIRTEVIRSGPVYYNPAVR